MEREQRENERDTFHTAFRLYVGRGRQVSAEMLADVTGIKHETIKSIHRGDYVPRGPELVRIMGALGPVFANSLLNQYGLEVRSLDDGNPCPFFISAELADVLRALLEMLSDPHSPGRLDHRELPQWCALARRASAMLTAHVAALEAGNVTPFSKGAA